MSREDDILREKYLSTRALQKPCRYQQNRLAAERKGVLIGVGPVDYLIQDSYTGETFKVPKSLVKEVALFGPEDMPDEKWLVGYFS